MEEKKNNLADEVCEPCRSNMPSLSLEEASLLLKDLHNAWSINSLGRLERVYLVNNFTKALNLAQRIGLTAEASLHYPDLHIAYGKLRVEVWTHKIQGLSRADFVLAAKFDQETDVI